MNINIGQMVARELCKDCGIYLGGGRPCPTTCGAYIALQQLANPTPKERTGHWRAIYQGDEIIDYRCTECENGSTFGKGTYGMNYCPSCGAKMIGEIK